MLPCESTTAVLPAGISTEVVVPSGFLTAIVMPSQSPNSPAAAVAIIAAQGILEKNERWGCGLSEVG